MVKGYRNASVNLRGDISVTDPPLQPLPNFHNILMSVKPSALLATSTGEFFTIQPAEINVETLTNQYSLSSAHFKLQATLFQSILVNASFISSK